MTEPSDLKTLLRGLAASGVDFVLVGGLAAVTQGAPISTFDVDIVPRRTPENVARLADFLETVNARYRRPGAPLAVNRSALLGAGHSLLMTDLGPLDVLGSIEEGMGYDELASQSVVLAFAGTSLRVLSLETIVRLKRLSSDNKDKLRLPVLEEALARSRATRS
jgi:hypothetical protein